VGLLFLVCSGVYLWVAQAEKRRLGIAALALGTLVCGWFVYGLRLLR
jgi:hypothetical protein